MNYSIEKIAEVLQAETSQLYSCEIRHLSTDSRKIIFPDSTLFFALDGPQRSGADFIAGLLSRGVRNFVVPLHYQLPEKIHNANFLKVSDVLAALQLLAAYHRHCFDLPVIGITGSNGKTLVKEWLYALLHEDYRIARSPRSYNSQTGVPLSVMEMEDADTLGIFEAGISKKEEMFRLEPIISPSVGILTGIGSAHDQGFKDRAEKLHEKLLLFVHSRILIYSPDTLPEGFSAEPLLDRSGLFTWSRSQKDSDLFVSQEQINSSGTFMQLRFHDELFSFEIPFTDRGSLNDILCCISLMLVLGYEPKIIASRMKELHPVEMRLQMKKGLNGCYILNDSYSNDLFSLELSLDYLRQQAGQHPTTVILSDILQSGNQTQRLYQMVSEVLQLRGIDRLIGIGPEIAKYADMLKNKVPQVSFFLSTEELLSHMDTHAFRNEYILLKGARIFAFERISSWLEQSVHRTVMEVNLSAMAHNLRQYQRYLKPSTKMMAMVKAFSYGSGSVEIARLLEFCKVDYLTVAYADEGKDLRNAGIEMPIMVMNADQASFDVLVDCNLEPNIYSFKMYHDFHAYLEAQGIRHFPVHVKLNTGMNRLGFDPEEVANLAAFLKNDETMVVKSVFSHLVASEDPQADAFTRQQNIFLEQGYSILKQALNYPFLKHIANSAAIFMHPELQYDMVRLGIGLYGVNNTDENSKVQLETVATLKSTIAQIRQVDAGTTIGYNRKGKVTRPSRIATVRIGYADGFRRSMGCGKGCVYLHGKLAPVVGNVCMDMVMIDITDIDGVKEGDFVEIFGKNLSVEQVARWCDTIPYEILTSVSRRVKRIYEEE